MISVFADEDISSQTQKVPLQRNGIAKKVPICARSSCTGNSCQKPTASRMTRLGR